jgi:hypothetical protein
MRVVRYALLLAAFLFAGSALAQDVPLFKLVAKDGKFEPAVLESPAGKRFRVEIANENKKAIEFESKDLKQEKVVAPRREGHRHDQRAQGGEYKYYDEFNEATGQGKIVAK